MRGATSIQMDTKIRSAENFAAGIAAEKKRMLEEETRYQMQAIAEAIEQEFTKHLQNAYYEVDDVYIVRFILNKEMTAETRSTLEGVGWHVRESSTCYDGRKHSCAYAIYSEKKK